MLGLQVGATTPSFKMLITEFESLVQAIRSWDAQSVVSGKQSSEAGLLLMHREKKKAYSNLSFNGQATPAHMTVLLTSPGSRISLLEEAEWR